MPPTFAATRRASTLASLMWAARSSCRFCSLSLKVGEEERVVKRSLRQLSCLYTSTQKWPKFGKPFQVKPSLEGGRGCCALGHEVRVGEVSDGLKEIDQRLVVGCGEF